MIRIAAILCFSLTLLCPVFCLAGAAGDGCAERGHSADENCEAMAVGAVVAKSTAAVAPAGPSSPALDRLLPDGWPARGCRRMSSSASRDRSPPRPPSASLRHALLQCFLF
jgi:hypothetical protein